MVGYQVECGSSRGAVVIPAAAENASTYSLPMDANHRSTAYRLTIRRRVSDIDEWRQTIERRAPQLRGAGVIGYSLSRVVDDHSETELVLEFADRDQAEAMARRLDLPESRENVLQAGAMEIGSMWLAEELAHGRLV
jgi:hypothetical protein